MVKIAGRGWKKISAAAALAVSPGGRGGRRRRVRSFFRLYEHDINGHLCAEFLRQLLRAVRGPITLVWDGLAVHRAPPVKALLARCPRVEVHRLPSYAPELNPVEPMWGNAKEVELRGYIPDDEIDLKIETHTALTLIGRRQTLLRSFINATPLRIPGINA